MVNPPWGIVNGINNKKSKMGKRRPLNKRLKKPRKSKKITTGKVMAPMPTLSHCAMKYATAIADPWSPAAEGACIPRHPSRPSMKVRGFGRFTATVGTNGYGFAYLTPCLANDKTGIIFSSSTYAGTLGSYVSVDGTGVVGANLSGLPFSSTQLTPNNTITGPTVAGRIVSMAMSWQYTGTVSKMGGLTYALCTPDHANINCIGSSNIEAFAETQIIRCDSQRHWLGISSLNDDELNYVEANYRGGSSNSVVEMVYPYSVNERFGSGTNNDAIGGAPCGIWFSGEPGNTFLIELVGHYEYVGQAAQYSLTPTHADSVGFEIVQAASQRLGGLSQAYPRATRPALMSTALTDVGRELAPVVGLAGRSLLHIGTRAIAGAAMGFARFGAAGMLTGAALGTASGALQLTNG